MQEKHGGSNMSQHQEVTFFSTVKMQRGIRKWGQAIRSQAQTW